MKHLVTSVLAILWIATLSIQAAWASKTEDSSNKDWSFTFAPYVWGAGLNGTVSTLPPRLPSVDIDASFGDIVDHLDFGFMGNAELRKGRFGVITDIVWTKISADSSNTLPSPLNRNLDLNSHTFMGTLAGAYRLVDEEHTWIDLVLGVRGWYVDTDLDVGPGVLASGRKIHHKEGWVDVIGGLRTRLDLVKGFYVSTYTLVGGGMSKGIMDVTGKIGYAFTNQLSAIAGYRYVNVNYEKSGFEWDVEYKGPILGGSYRF